MNAVLSLFPGQHGLAACPLILSQDSRPELDVDWIHPWIGLGWIGLGRNFREKFWIGLGQRSYISKFLYSVFRK